MDLQGGLIPRALSWPEFESAPIQTRRAMSLLSHRASTAVSGIFEVDVMLTAVLHSMGTCSLKRHVEADSKMGGPICLRKAALPGTTRLSC